MVWIGALGDGVLQYRLQAFDDSALLGDDELLVLHVLLQKLVVSRDGLNFGCQALVVFSQALKERIHLLQLRHIWLKLAQLLKLFVLVL